MPKLVIAEKRSVGEEIARFLGAGTRKDGYFEGSGYVVTWCQGHLVELCMPTEYDDLGWDSWDRSVLPMIPAHDGWRWKPGKARGRSGRLVNNPQLKVVCDLMRRPDVECVINACDPDREGEGIFRRVYAWSHAQKGIRRLWSSSLTDKALRKAFADLKDGRTYDGLGAAAELRAKEDWLVGMNGSRLYHRSVGRVRTPTLRFVVDRDREIEGFVSKPFWQVVCDLGDGLVVRSRKLERESEARELASRCAGAVAHDFEVESKRVKVGAPTLFNTTAMQKAASKALGCTPSDVDDGLQRLYEKKLGSYPRTSSKYITAADERDVKELIALISQIPSLAGVAALLPSAGPLTTRLVNDKKVEGHTALLPTEMLSAEALAGLSGIDESLALMLCIRLLQATMPDGLKEVTAISCVICDETFTARAERMVEAGWTASEEAAKALVKTPKKDGRGRARRRPDAEGGDDEGEVLRCLPGWLGKRGETPVVGSDLKAGKTKPPARFTDATLLEAMEHAARFVEGKELKQALSGSEVHAGGLGTDATRGDIIKALVDKKFLRRDRGKLLSTEEGRSVVDTVCESLKSPVLTAEMETRLADVEHGKASADAVLGEIEAFVRKVVAEAPAEAPRRQQQARELKRVGTCPVCGGAIVHGNKTYRCENQTRKKNERGEWVDAGSCTFFVFDTVCGRSVSEPEMGELLAGRTLTLKGFTSKAGKPFGAGLYLDVAEHRLKLSFS